jgi:hypothetical protein
MERQEAGRSVQFRTFTSYAQHHTRAKHQALCSIEQSGAPAAFEKCRELAEQICAELRTRKPGRLNPRALAEFQVAIERAACVLNEQIRVAEPPKKLHSQIVPIYGGTQGCLPRSSLNRSELERAAKAARVKKAVNHLQFSSAASPIVDRISTPANFQAAPSFLCMRLTCCQQPWRQWLSPGGRTPVIGRERFRDG